MRGSNYHKRSKNCDPPLLQVNSLVVGDRLPGKEEGRARAQQRREKKPIDSRDSC